MEVEGYSNYLIYADGRVYSQKAKIFLKPRVHTNGYLRYMLKRTDFYVHRLVATYYIPNPNNLSYVDHIDRDKTNNNVENLRWVTPRTNNWNKNTNNEHINITETTFGHYMLRFKRQNEYIFCKTFHTLEEAIIARDNFFDKNPKLR
jgi:hypothetical protein